MRKRNDLAGRTAVVTGAGSGIGRGLAQVLAGRGCDLALVDIDATGLAGTAALLADLRAKVRLSRHVLDIADADAVAALPASLAAEHPGVDMLVNNAGVAVGGNFEELAGTDMAWLFDINFWGTVRMTQAFLPLLKRSGRGWIVNVSSAYALTPPPGSTIYAASKFAVRGFSQALRLELHAHRIGVSIVYPAAVSTDIVSSSRQPLGSNGARRATPRNPFGKVRPLSAESAAERIARGIERGSPRILVGLDARAAALFERAAPSSYWRLVKTSMRLFR